MHALHVYCIVGNFHGVLFFVIFSWMTQQSQKFSSTKIINDNIIIVYVYERTKVLRDLGVRGQPRSSQEIQTTKLNSGSFSFDLSQNNTIHPQNYQPHGI